MKDNPGLNKIEQKLNTLSNRQYEHITWLLFGWMSNGTADSKEYI